MPINHRLSTINRFRGCPARERDPKGVAQIRRPDVSRDNPHTSRGAAGRGVNAQRSSLNFQPLSTRDGNSRLLFGWVRA
jgi:hypothetical protein